MLCSYYDLPREMVVKFFPKNGLLQHCASGSALPARFAAEVHSYRHLDPDVYPRPRTFFAGGDKKTKCFAIVMERLVGPPISHLPSPLKEEHVGRILRSLARLHGRYWGGPVSLGGPHDYGGSAVGFIGMSKKLRGQLRQLAAEQWGCSLVGWWSALPADVTAGLQHWPLLLTAKLDRLLENVFPLRPKNAPLHSVCPVALLAGDLRPDNIFLEDDQVHTLLHTFSNPCLCAAAELLMRPDR
eukprot:SAG31_NODE_463_length_15332_cov_5.907700_2_plen_242_part_00